MVKAFIVCLIYVKNYSKVQQPIRIAIIHKGVATCRNQPEEEPEKLRRRILG